MATDIITPADQSAATSLCRNNHDSDRYADGRCKKCVSESARRQYIRQREKRLAKQKEYRENNPEKVKASLARWYMNHKEEVRIQGVEWRNKNAEKHRSRLRHYRAKNLSRLNAYLARWMELNRDRFNAKCGEWKRNNAGKVREYNAAREAKIRQATPVWADREEIRAIYEKAARLQDETGLPHEVDHIIPLINPYVCGLHVPANLQILTASENRRKSNKLIMLPELFDVLRTDPCP